MTVAQRQVRYQGEGGVVPALAFTSLPAANEVAPGTVYRIPELNNAELISDGVIWKPRGGRQIIKSLSIPVGAAPTGSVAANGAVTLGTALNTTFSQGMWLYYPAGAAYAGSAAGFYWTVMSSDTLGTIYDDTYDPTTDTGAPPTSLTPIVAAGPGAFTGTTSTLTALSVNIPGGLIHTQGGIATYSRAAVNNNTNSKNMLARYGGAQFGSSGVTSSLAGSKQFSFANLGVTNMQACAPWGDFATSSAAPILAVDSSVAQDVTIILQTSAAPTDVLTATGMTVELLG